MSLDDIIKNNKKSTTDSNPRFRGRFSGGGTGGGGGAGGGPGPTRRFNSRSANRSNPYSSAPKVNTRRCGFRLTRSETPPVSIC